MIVKEKLTQLRRRAGFTQQELADILGVERSTYTGYEVGKTQIPVDKIQMLSVIYNVPLDFFMEYEGSFLNDVSQFRFEPEPENDTALTKEERVFLAQIRLLNAGGKTEEVRAALNKLTQEL